MRNFSIPAFIILVAVGISVCFAREDVQPRLKGTAKGLERLLGPVTVDDKRNQVVCVHIPIQDRAKIAAVTSDLDNNYDAWNFNQNRGCKRLLVSRKEQKELELSGYSLESDMEETALVAAVEASGIAGYPCYRSVEETYATIDSIVQNYPNLAEKIDIGDSWEKTQDPANGYDLFVLKLTNKSMTGVTKPVAFFNFAIHAREYTTAELGTRLAESLVGDYGEDADTTWLLNHHEVHLLLQTNPDGRKKAETGELWRKNTNSNTCNRSNRVGVDLNRNFDFKWACCTGGSSSKGCDQTYHGEAAGSEPEIQALQNHVKSIFPANQRGTSDTDASPDDAMGVAIDVHSYGEDILYPWGWTVSEAPNHIQFQTLSRKLAYFNNYQPAKGSGLHPANGVSDDYYYGTLGIAGLTYELGTSFFQDCGTFESTILPDNLDSLKYAAMVARTPFLTPAGPDVTSINLSSNSVTAGESVTVTAVVDDTRYREGYGEPNQAIGSASIYVDVPPWDTGASSFFMSASDGIFDASVETVVFSLDTTGLSDGQHMIYVQGTDVDGKIGLVKAEFLSVVAACTSDVDCDDGIYCNGAETCKLSTGVCELSSSPCGPGQACDDDLNICVDTPAPGEVPSVTPSDSAAPSDIPTVAPVDVCQGGGNNAPCSPRNTAVAEHVCCSLFCKNNGRCSSPLDVTTPTAAPVDAPTTNPGCGGNNAVCTLNSDCCSGNCKNNGRCSKP